MFQLFFIATVLVALALVGLAVGVFVKGKFPQTHIGHNDQMKKLGVTCAKNDSELCQGRSKSNECRGCNK